MLIQFSVVQLGIRVCQIAVLVVNVVALVVITAVTTWTVFFASSSSFGSADLGAMVAWMSNGAAVDGEKNGTLQSWTRYGDHANSLLSKSVVELDCRLESPQPPSVRLLLHTMATFEAAQTSSSDRGTFMEFTDILR